MAGTSRADDGRKVGELAAAAGLTVRTLHYYEELGLLEPSGRTDSGHRLYGAGEVERLYRICLLRRLGFPLAEIERALDDPMWSLRSAVDRHLADVDRRLEGLRRLRGRLAALQRSTRTGDSPLTTHLLDLLEEMTMTDSAVQHRISYLVYEDLEAAYDYLIRVFKLGPGEVTRDEGGTAVHAELDAGDGVIWLHRETPELGLASPRTAGGVTAGTAVLVDDVDAHFRHAAAQGASIVYEPVDQPYGYREYSARDHEGGLWSFMRALDAG